jgi:hypothetical protein
MKPVVIYGFLTWLILELNGAPEWAAVGASILVVLLLPGHPSKKIGSDGH